MAVPIRGDQRPRSFPWVTLALLAINVVVYMFVQPAGFQVGLADDPAGQGSEWRLQEQEEFAYQWGAVACEVVSGQPVSEDPAQCEGEGSDYLPATKSIVASLLACMFLHGSIVHLAGNMLYLWVFGSMVEGRLGWANFLGLYLVGGVMATLGFVASNATSVSPLIGASGAIAAAMGAYLVLFPRARILTIIATAAFQVVYVPASIVLLLYFVTQFFTGEGNVAWEAHAAGMVAGAIIALALMRIPAIRERGQQHASDASIRVGADF